MALCDDCNTMCDGECDRGKRAWREMFALLKALNASGCGRAFEEALEAIGPLLKRIEGEP